MTSKEILKQLSGYAKGMRLLYVEDEILIRENTQAIFSSLFAHVETAVNGKEGLKQYQKGVFDLVITDILMPEMNGISMIQTIKRLNPSQIIIVTSACEDCKYVPEFENLGVSRFILKPMETDQMIQILHETLQNIHTTRNKD